MQFAAEGRERAHVDVEQVVDPLPRESGVDVRHIDKCLCTQNEIGRRLTEHGIL